MASNCPICLDSFEESTPTLCCTPNHSLACKNCIIEYLKHSIAEPFLGTCPPICCPLHQSKRRPILMYSIWGTVSNGFVSPDLLARYSNLAESVLNFQCSSCHTRGSLFVKPASVSVNNDTSMIAIKEWLAANNVTENSELTIEMLNNQLDLYCNGMITTDEFYTYISNNMVPNYSFLSDATVWTLIRHILFCIDNPERRSNLQLRHYRSRPRVWTRCCNAEHCFQCNTKGFHENKSCEVNLSSLDGSINVCPACGISIVKGDGCDSVSCVCGRQFGWSAELAVTRDINTFVQAFPVNTSDKCAVILCGDSPYATSTTTTTTTTTTIPIPTNTNSFLGPAKSWRIRHKGEVDRSLIRWWGKTFAPFPHQACALLQTRMGSMAVNSPDPISLVKLVLSNSQQESCQFVKEGIMEAHRLWYSSNQMAVAAVTLVNEMAAASLFLSFHRDEASQAMACLQYSKNGTSDCGYSRLCIADAKRYERSLLAWKTANADAVAQVEADFDSRLAQQFVSLYGHTRAPIDTLIATMTKFRPKFEMKNPASKLQVSSDQQSVHCPYEPDGISYPASIQLPKSGYHKILLQLSRFRERDAIEGEKYTPLVMIELSNNNEMKPVFLYNALHDQMITIFVNIKEMTAEVHWTTLENQHQQSTVRLRANIYQRNDPTKHVSLLLRCGRGFQLQLRNSMEDQAALRIFNDAHMEMLAGYMSRIRKIARKDVTMDVGKVGNLAKKWIKFHNGSMHGCSEAYNSLQSFVEVLINSGSKDTCKDKISSPMKRIQTTNVSKRPISVTSPDPAIQPEPLSAISIDISYQNLVHAICWGRIHGHKTEYTDSPNKSPCKVSPEKKKMPTELASRPIQIVPLRRRAMLVFNNEQTPSLANPVTEAQSAARRASQSSRESVYVASTASRRAQIAAVKAKASAALPKTESNMSLQSMGSTGSTSTSMQSRGSTASIRSISTKGSSARSTISSTLRAQHIRSSISRQHT